MEDGKELGVDEGTALGEALKDGEVDGTADGWSDGLELGVDEGTALGEALFLLFLPLPLPLPLLPLESRRKPESRASIAWLLDWKTNMWIVKRRKIRLNIMVEFLNGKEISGNG